MNNKIYHKLGNKWYEQTFKNQCQKDLLLIGQCQGTEGHDGSCWCYKPNGTYCIKKEGSGMQWIPPGHKNWISPLKKIYEYHLSGSETVLVTDQELVDKLENDENFEYPTTRPI